MPSGVGVFGAGSVGGFFPCRKGLAHISPSKASTMASGGLSIPYHYPEFSRTNAEPGAT